MHCRSVSLPKQTVQKFLIFFHLSAAKSIFIALFFCFVLGNNLFLGGFYFFPLLCAATLANHGHFLHLYCALHNAGLKCIYYELFYTLLWFDNHHIPPIQKYFFIKFIITQTGLNETKINYLTDIKY